MCRNRTDGVLRVPLQLPIGETIKKILPKNLIVPMLLGKLKGKKWILGSSHIECAIGYFEYEKRLLIEKIVTSESTFYDIGANVGFYTLLASELVGENGNVISFEPVPRNVKYLRELMKLNKCNNVIIYEVAVKNKSGVSKFDEGISSSTGHLSDDGYLRVKTVSIDDLVGNDKVPKPDYIKIDVEGAELLVLNGAEYTLNRFEPKIFLATHSKNLHKDCINFLRSIGYQIKPITGRDLYSTNEIFAYK